MAKVKGKQTVKIESPLSIISTASIAGPKEGRAVTHYP